MRIDFWSALLLIVIFQGIFLISVLLFSPKKRIRKENTYLVGILLVLIWFMLEFFSIRQRLHIPFSIFYGTRYGSWFLLGPLSLFYFKSMVDQQWKPRLKEILHFLPFLIFVVVLPLFVDDIINKRQVDYGMLSVFDHRKKVISPIQYVYAVVFIAQFIHLGFYLFRNLYIIRNYSRALRFEYAHIEPALRWAKLFNRILLVVVVFSSLFLYLLLVTDIYRRHLDYIYVLPTGVLFYVIGYYLMNAEWQPIQLKKEKYAKSTLKLQEVATYVQQLKDLIENEKIYLNSKIRLDDVAKMMGIPSHHVSQIVNEHFNSTFFDLINSCRVEEAKKRIQQHPEYTLLRIAFDAGFNNKTSFVNAFKKFDGNTPSAFRKAVVHAN